MTTKPTITVAENGNLHIHIPMILRRMQGRKRIIMPETLDGKYDNPLPVQNSVAQALIKSFAWSEMIETNQVKSITNLGGRLGVDGSYVTRILKLSTLAPDIIEAIFNGEEPDGLSLTKLTKSFPMNWQEQRKIFGFHTGERLPDGLFHTHLPE